MGGRTTRRSGVAVALVVVTMGLLAACAPQPSPDPLDPTPAAAGLRVMTYNLLGAQADGNVYSEWAGWSARVAQLRPDVLVVEEAQGGDIAALVGASGGAYRLASYLTWECDLKGDPEGVGILVRSDVNVTGSGGVHVGESCLDPTVRRILVWADLALSTGPLRVYGTHLTAGGGASASSREAQIRAIRQRIFSDDPDGARRWVLAGDLNATPGSFGFRLMTGAVAAEAGPYRFVDTYADRHPLAGDTTACPTVAATDAPAMAALLADPAHVRECGYSAGWPKDDNPIGCDLLSLCTSWEQRRDVSVRERIDAVLVPAGGPVTVAAATVPNRADADWAAVGSEWFRLSDHLPVIVDLQVA